MQGGEDITKDNFFKLTRGRFEPCPTPRRAPDRKTKDSSYWFDDQGVTRRSDHWGWGIATCTWTYGDEEACHCGKTKKLGERTGRISWSELETPRVEIHLTHQFGDLDYDAIGSEPVSQDIDEYGPYDVFELTRDMISDKGGKVVFAGNEHAYGNGRDKINLSAAGEAYKDAAAQSISAAWKAERDAARAEKRRVKLSDWLPTQVGDPVHGELAARTVGAAASAPNEKSREDVTSGKNVVGEGQEKGLPRSTAPKPVERATWMVLAPGTDQGLESLYIMYVLRFPLNHGWAPGAEAGYVFFEDVGEEHALFGDTDEHNRMHRVGSMVAPAETDPLGVMRSALPPGEDNARMFDPATCAAPISEKEFMTIKSRWEGWDLVVSGILDRIPECDALRGGGMQWHALFSSALCAELDKLPGYEPGEILAIREEALATPAVGGTSVYLEHAKEKRAAYLESVGGKPPKTVQWGLSPEAHIDAPDNPDEPMGTWRVETAEEIAQEHLYPRSFGTLDFPTRLEPGDTVYRIGDDAFVTEDDWDEVWGKFPSWARLSYVVADNSARYGSSDVAAMTIFDLEQLDLAALDADHVYCMDVSQEELEELAALRDEPHPPLPISAQRAAAERSAQTGGHTVAIPPRGGTSR